MQLKSAIMLCTGVAFGWMIFQSDDKKEKTINNIKKVMYKLQTGEDYPKPKMKPVRTNYNAKYYQTKYDRTKLDKYRKVTFKDAEKAEEILDWMKEQSREYKNVSVYELSEKLGMNEYDFTWDNYGWSWYTIMGSEVIQQENSLTKEKYWEINLPDPSPLLI